MVDAGRAFIVLGFCVCVKHHEEEQQQQIHGLRVWWLPCHDHCGDMFLAVKHHVTFLRGSSPTIIMTR